VQHRLLPMCNQPLRTLVDTDEGELVFQDYFVRRQCAPAVRGIRFYGTENAVMSAEVSAALQDPALRAIIVCPSNPLLSIAPILAVPGMREALQKTAANVIVVSPLVGGQAVKGPTAKMLQEMAIPTDSNSIAGFYAGLLDVLVIDDCDRKDLTNFSAADFSVQTCKTLMKTGADKLALATSLLQLV
jgi:LPPG:FO 2-phospho-L-lactate transferase